MAKSFGVPASPQSRVIDRRLNGKRKSAINRERFIRRYKKQLKAAVASAVLKRSIKDMDKGEEIVIPAKDLSEPIFQHGKGGWKRSIHPGNKEFAKGDQLQRPEEGAKGNGSDASDRGEGDDDFTFSVSREEFLELFFDDLELPDLVKTRMGRLDTFQYIRAGYTQNGVPANINIIRSLRGATARRIALSAPQRKKIRQAESRLTELLLTKHQDDPDIVALRDEIAALKRKINAIPFIDTFDLRYNNRIKQSKPTTQAVMFCLMDVSGSMDAAKKDIAKRFFILLYLFLRRNYEKIEIVFIRHHTSAKEVNEEEFFYSRETGGTVVSSALELMRDVIADRYAKDEWNIYAAQASDGDNWNADSPYCKELLLNDILPFLQYYAYVEIMPRHHQSLWEAYTAIKTQVENFSMQPIDNVVDIYLVFRELFKRQIVG